MYAYVCICVYGVRVSVCVRACAREGRARYVAYQSFLPWSTLQDDQTNTNVEKISATSSSGFPAAAASVPTTKESAKTIARRNKAATVLQASWRGGQARFKVKTQNAAVFRQRARLACIYIACMPTHSRCQFFSDHAHVRPRCVHLELCVYLDLCVYLTVPTTDSRQKKACCRLHKL